MLDRLKSLPLTIILTILIWMYAEAQFTAVQPDVKVNVQALSPSPDYALRVFDPENSRFTPLMNLVATLQGPRNSIERIYQDSLPLTAEDVSAGLTYVPTVPEITKAAAKAGTTGVVAPVLAAAPNGGILEVNTVSMLNRFDYFHSKGITVTHVSPARIQVVLDPVTRLQKRVEFKSQLVDRFTLSPDVVEVLIPRAALEKIGGADQLKVVAEPSRSFETLASDAEHTIPVRFVVEYAGSRDERIRVSPGTGNLTAHILRQQQAAVQIPDVPVWLSGPPSILGKYDIDVQPRTTAVTVSGSATAIDALKNRIESGGTRSAGVYAYLDITAEDAPAATATRRRIRFVLPEGLTQLSVSGEVAYRLVERPSPAAPPATRER
jgi:hypothetical protein